MLALCARKFISQVLAEPPEARQLLRITERGGTEAPRVGVMRRLLGPQAQGQSSLGPCAEPAGVLAGCRRLSEQPGRHALSSVGLATSDLSG